jgi:hypothetical protein
MNTPTRKPVDLDAIDFLADQSGFRSTSTQTERKPVRVRRFRTNRNFQLNIKMEEETAELFYHIADKMDVPLGVAFRRIVDHFNRSQTQGAKDE